MEVILLGEQLVYSFDKLHARRARRNAEGGGKESLSIPRRVVNTLTTIPRYIKFVPTISDLKKIKPFRLQKLYDFQDSILLLLLLLLFFDSITSFSFTLFMF